MVNLSTAGDILLFMLICYGGRLHDRVVGRRPPVLQIADQRSNGVRHLHNGETRADSTRVFRLRGRAM